MTGHTWFPSLLALELRHRIQSHTVCVFLSPSPVPQRHWSDQHVTRTPWPPSVCDEVAQTQVFALAVVHVIAHILAGFPSASQKSCYHLTDLLHGHSPVEIGVGKKQVLMLEHIRGNEYTIEIQNMLTR